MAGWAYLFFELNGDGTETFITAEALVSKPTLTRVLSGPHQITGTLDRPYADLINAASNRVALKRWKTTVYAEDPNGKIWVGGIVADFTIDGPVVTLDVTGFTTAPKGQPYDGEIADVGIDPLNIIRALWADYQSRPGSNLGLVVDSTVSGLSYGIAPPGTGASENQNTDTTAGPIMINWWSTTDVAGQIDALAAEAPFDYLEQHYWSGNTISHFLQLGYPHIGVTRDLRLVLGENVHKRPQETYPTDEVVTEVWVFGGGTGRDRIRGVASIAPTDSIRRVRVVDDKTVTDQATANARASKELALYQPNPTGADIVELVITNHPNAPLGSYDVGDVLLYQGDHEWGSVAVWVKILKMAISPESGDDVTATVIRTDRIRS